VLVLASLLEITGGLARSSNLVSRAAIMCLAARRKAATISAAWVKTRAGSSNTAAKSWRRAGFSFRGFGLPARVVVPISEWSER
jgi:hypothetical protein